MDVVYPYRQRPSDFELRFSLRSLAHVPHDRVIVAGEAPKHLSKAVRYLPVPRRVNRYDASTNNIFEAAKREVRTDRFLVMNDDIFLLGPWAFQHEDRGTVEEYISSGAPKGDYLRHLLSTADILRAHGVPDPLFFGLHTPTVYERAKLVDLIKEFAGKRYLLRTLYHNLFPQPSVRREDAKVREWTGAPVRDDVLSISDQCARDAGFVDWISARFPEPSVHEIASRHRIAA